MSEQELQEIKARFENISEGWTVSEGARIIKGLELAGKFLIAEVELSKEIRSVQGSMIRHFHKTERELKEKLDRVELAEAKARLELEDYRNNIDYKELLTFAKKYGCSFINASGELIICHATNTYASLHDCKTLEDIEAKVLMAVCRPIGKGLTKKHANIQLQKFNTYFKSDLTVDDMRLIYGELCYSHKLQENKDFIRNGFPMHELQGTPHE